MKRHRVPVYGISTGHGLVTEAIEAAWEKMSMVDRDALVELFVPLVGSINGLGKKGTVELIGRLGIIFCMLGNGRRADASLRNCLDELGVMESCADVVRKEGSE